MSIDVSSETSEEIDVAASLWAVRERPLSGEDEALLTQWLAGDPRRRGALLRAQAAWETLSRAQAFDDRQLALGVDSHRRDETSRRAFMYAAGAGLVAAVGVAGLAWIRRGGDVATGVGEILRQPLSDGSVATINADSAIRVEMGQSQRRIELVRGEAWFKVAHNKARPFIVSAGPARVEAVGTAFSVRRREDGADVLVTEGSVKAWLTSDAAAPVVLRAGDRTFVGNSGIAGARHAPQSISDDLAWRDGQIVLTGQSLEEAAEDYNRYNRLKIVIQGPDLANQRLLGRFSTDDPEGFCDIVAQAFDAKITRSENVIILSEGKK
jgi:transmembrane sensor